MLFWKQRGIKHISKKGEYNLSSKRFAIEAAITIIIIIFIIINIIIIVVIIVIIIII